MASCFFFWQCSNESLFWVVFFCRVSPVTCTWRCVQFQTRAPCRSLPSLSSLCLSETSESSRSALQRAANHYGWGKNFLEQDESERKCLNSVNFHNFSIFLLICRVVNRKWTATRYGYCYTTAIPLLFHCYSTAVPQLYHCYTTQWH